MPPWYQFESVMLPGGRDESATWGLKVAHALIVHRRQGLRETQWTHDKVAGGFHQTQKEEVNERAKTEHAVMVTRDFYPCKILCAMRSRTVLKDQKQK